MRLNLILIALCFLTVLQAQDNDKKMIGFGCYYQGAETKPVIKIRNLINEGKYKQVSSLLNNGSSGEKFLAVITIERLAALGLYNLNDEEKKQILSIKTSSALVSVCSGCTYFNKVPLKKMFSENNFLGSQFWLDRVFKPKV